MAIPAQYRVNRLILALVDLFLPIKEYDHINNAIDQAKKGQVNSPKKIKVSSLAYSGFYLNRVSIQRPDGRLTFTGRRWAMVTHRITSKID